jgi:hypothetical protein
LLGPSPSHRTPTAVVLACFSVGSMLQKSMEVNRHPLTVVDQGASGARVHFKCLFNIYIIYIAITRNGRRRLRGPVQIPPHRVAMHLADPIAVVVPSEFATSRFTVAWPLSRRPGGLYPLQSSAHTVTAGTVAGGTVASTNSAELLRRPTRDLTRPLARPTTPGPAAARSPTRCGPWPGRRAVSAGRRVRCAASFLFAFR